MKTLNYLLLGLIISFILYIIIFFVHEDGWNKGFEFGKTSNPHYNSCAAWKDETRKVVVLAPCIDLIAPK